MHGSLKYLIFGGLIIAIAFVSLQYEAIGKEIFNTATPPATQPAFFNVTAKVVSVEPSRSVLWWQPVESILIIKIIDAEGVFETGRTFQYRTATSYQKGDKINLKCHGSHDKFIDCNP